ncbi:MAG: TonB-dependent receptor [Rikenellaceae bacterium]|nr:TonB-dependent receptor [Rikenellaceae bacterium]
MAQQRVTGTVTDATGEPVIGASVIVEGTTVGTTTGIDGEYAIAAPGDATLVFSFLGFKDQAIKVGSQTTINVTLTEDAAALDEVVVIGYGTVKKRDLTGAVASVKSETITMTPTSNPMEALQGRVAGLDITKSSGQAGSGVNMQLRGNRSFTASGTPTFIIDGMPGDYSTLNPNDIESIEVLKDASSTAIYGSSGANGVILITTKQGQAGKVNVNFNAYVGVNGWSTMPEVLQGEAYMENRRQAARNAGIYVNDEALFTDPTLYAAYKAGQNINWVDAIMDTGMTQNYSLSVSGGNDKTKAYMSFNFSDEKGQYANDENKVYSTNIRVDHQVNKWLAAGVNMQGSFTYRDSAWAKLDDGLTAIPFGELYNENGELNPVLPGGEYNLLLNTDQNNYRNHGQNTRLYVNPYIRITPLKGLTIESRLNGSLGYSRSNSFVGQGSFQYVRAGGNWETDTSATVNKNESYSYKWENIVTYNFTIADDHDFTVTGVTSYNHNQSDNASMTGTGIKNNKTLWYDLANAVTMQNSTSYSMSKGMAYIGRLNYSYKGRYLFSASVRHDGSSRLADDYRWDTFPAVSAAWRISDESFMEGTRDWMDNLKLRVGYGETGTASIDPYSSVSSLEQTMITIGDQLIQPTYNFTQTIANKSLGWERSKSWNIGIDASFFRGRIDLTMDYYNTKTEGVIWQKNLPIINGGYAYNKPFNTNVNIAETKNKGIEILLNTRNIVKKDFTWNSTFTFAYNKEEITKLAGTENDVVINGDYALAIGEAVNSYRELKKVGIWQTDEAAEAAIFGQKPGHIKVDVPGMVRHAEGSSVYYTKVDADGVEHRYDATNTYAISGADAQILGHNSPDWTMGINNTFTYKNFDLSIYMYLRWGSMFKYNLATDYDPTGENNYPAHFNVWSPENPSNDFPALDANISNKLADYTGFSSLAYVDGSFFKIKNITLGYTLPSKVCKKIGIQNLRVYGTITNPLVVAKSDILKDYDPELNGNLNFPLTKQLVFGVNFSF